MTPYSPENSIQNAWALGRGVTKPLHAQAAAFLLLRRAEIYAYLVTLGIQPDDAQELTNESFLRYYIALRGDQTIENPRAWVYCDGSLDKN